MTTESALNRQTVQDWLVQYIASVVDIPTGSVATDTPFRDLGVDSAEVVIMTGVLEEEFSIEVNAELPFTHPTITRLLDALEEQGIVGA